MIVYRILLVIDAVIAALVTLFVILVLPDFSSHTPEPGRDLLYTILLGVVLMAGALAPLILGLLFKARGRLEQAKLILFVPVLPAIGYALFMAILFSVH